MKRLLVCLFALRCTVALAATAFSTERLYLSGLDSEHTVPWKFMCTSGAQSGYWTNIAVPSHWDMHGFGTLTYKKDATNAWDEKGLYEHAFVVPAEWRGRRLFLVFEGVMTDCTAKLNGTIVGPTHQGGFYRFKHEITTLAKFGETNRLEVEVARHSSNESVNKAERLADYWVFAGIYRPVYIEAVPAKHIERVAIDAKHDGKFAMEVYVSEGAAGDIIEAQVLSPSGKPVGKPFSTSIDMGDPKSSARAVLRTSITQPRPWSAESPTLYSVRIRLKRERELVHEVTQRFGFRTFEVRDGDGLYLNNRKIVLQGVNRHSFWPDSGRCLSERIHRLDVSSLKAMNANAVRMSHYPPDSKFLELCDEVGLYVLDELAGWHNSYETDIGTSLVKAMVTRDVNHPCILFWDNGNEGGSNPKLDAVFHQYDPQKRRVLHPWKIHSGLNTAHYLAYTNAVAAAQGKPMHYHPEVGKEFINTNLPSGLIYMPTEFMHGLYDGGAGAGLSDYWDMMTKSPLCAGGFIWVWTDDVVKRPGTGLMDSAGNQAPDGIVGPYREREASFYSIRQIWSPIQVRRLSDGTLEIQNRFSFTDAKWCEFTWQMQGLPPALDPAGAMTILAAGKLKVPSIAPGATGVVRPKLASGKKADLLLLIVKNPDGVEIQRLSWDIQQDAAKPVAPKPQGPVVAQESPELLELSADGLTVGISKASGLLVSVRRGNQAFSLTNGPVLPFERSELRSFKHGSSQNGYRAIAAFAGQLQQVEWELSTDGTLTCSFRYDVSGATECAGVVFDYPEDLVVGKRWVGDGPQRVWRNRLQGATHGLWANDYNDTITGHKGWIYPEFKGCFSAVKWLRLETREGTIIVEPRNVPFVQVLTPSQPPDELVANTKVSLPKCGLGFLHVIPAIGTKFKPAASMGPQSEAPVVQGPLEGAVTFHFR